MKKLEEMGNTLVNTALHYKHPNYSDMYPNWGVVYKIGETLIEMTNQPTLNDNQQIVLDWLKNQYSTDCDTPLEAIDDLTAEVLYPNGFKTCILNAFVKLNNEEQFQVLAAFATWGQSEVAE